MPTAENAVAMGFGMIAVIVAAVGIVGFAVYYFVSGRNNNRLDI